MLVIASYFCPLFTFSNSFRFILAALFLYGSILYVYVFSSFFGIFLGFPCLQIPTSMSQQLKEALNSKGIYVFFTEEIKSESFSHRFLWDKKLQIFVPLTLLLSDEEGIHVFLGGKITAIFLQG